MRMGILRSRCIGPTYFPSNIEGRSYVWMNFPSLPKNWVQFSTFRWPTLSNSVVEARVDCLDETHKGPPYKTGGPLFLRRRTQEQYPSDVVTLEAGTQKYIGLFTTNIPQDPHAALYSSYAQTAGMYGSEVWSKARPVKPAVNVGQWFAELRDFPRMMKVVILKFIEMGSLYLNYEFGWKPFIGDVIKYLKLLDAIDARIYRIRKYNGQWQKRKGTIRNTIDTSTLEVSSLLLPGVSGAWYPGGVPAKTRKTTVTSDRVWYEGRMKYYVPRSWFPKGPTVTQKDFITSKLVRRLAGLEITPSAAYALIPFTWLTNWVIDIQSFVDNFSYPDDNLVAKYMYVMRHRSTSVHYDTTQKFTSAVGSQSVHATAYSLCECKERAEGSPWGFGAAASNWTTRQWAIIFALGLSLWDTGD